MTNTTSTTMHDSDSVSPEDGWQANNDDSRRTRSCAECRRRRVRCDGSTVPCRQCAYYLVPHLCHYPRRKVRRSPSIKLYTELSNAYETSQSILRKLFPFTSTAELASMSRQQLLHMANNSRSPSNASDSPASQQHIAENVNIEGLQTIEPAPDEEFGWNEFADRRAIASRGPLIEDDVNGLSLINDDSPTASSSYLGFTSIPSMIRVLLKVTTRQGGEVGRDAFTALPPAKSGQSQVMQPINLSACEIDEPAFINAYFSRVHAITPMVDEADFRRRVAVDKGSVEEQSSGSWRALKNMVLALGSIASTEASQPTHILYYQRASQYFDLSCLGSGHIHTVQALALLGGFYLHYCNRPNMASAVMGAAVRAAVGMGLHLANQSPIPGKGHASLARQKDIEIRIRTWWSVICLDTWAGTTLGRPDVGCVGNALVSTSLPTLRFSMDYEAISLRASQSFCQIAGRIQERLAKRPIIHLTEVEVFDEELKAWWMGLHPLFRESATVPESLRTARGLLRCRFWTTRLTLYRPHLLRLALKETITGLPLTEDEHRLVQRSGDIAMETVGGIINDWFPNQMSAWHGVWHIFQAGLALLVVISAERDPQKLEAWNRGAQAIISVLPEMEQWSTGAARSLDAIQYLLARVKPAPNNHSGTITPQNFLDNQDYMTLLDQMLTDGSDWFDINEANFVYE